MPPLSSFTDSSCRNRVGWDLVSSNEQELEAPRGEEKKNEGKKNQNKNKPYGIHTQMPLKQPQTFLLPQAANVVKQLLGWGTSKVH